MCWIAVHWYASWLRAMPIVLDFGSMGTGMKNTTCSPMAFILNGVALSNPYRTPRTKKKESNFSRALESARKDVERCFGVMQARWNIITQPCRLWNTSVISDVMYACIIIHNMIIEDESGRDLKILTPEVASSSSSGMRRGFTFADLTRETALIEDTDTYYNLRDDLVQYLWEHKGLNAY
jgi:hypothetical protein